MNKPITGKGRRTKLKIILELQDKGKGIFNEKVQNAKRRIQRMLIKTQTCVGERKAIKDFAEGLDFNIL